jgi:hypothetical protein
MVTVASGPPDMGEKPEMAGINVTVNCDGLTAVPAGVTTAIGPVVAAAGTRAVTWVAEFSVNVDA